MSKVVDVILASLYDRLVQSSAIDAATIASLRALLESGRKLRADDVVSVLAKASTSSAQ